MAARTKTTTSQETPPVEPSDAPKSDAVKKTAAKSEPAVKKTAKKPAKKQEAAVATTTAAKKPAAKKPAKKAAAKKSAPDDHDMDAKIDEDVATAAVDADDDADKKKENLPKDAIVLSLVDDEDDVPVYSPRSPARRPTRSRTT